MTHNFCPACGEALTIKGKFCPKCGHSLTSTTNQEGITGNQESPQQQVSAKRKKNQWIYIIVALLIAIFAYQFFLKSTPEKVANKFVDAVLTFEFEKAKELVAFSADEYFKDDLNLMIKGLRDDPRAAREKLNELKQEGYVLDKFIVQEKDESKGFVSLTVEMIMKNGDEDTGYIDLIKESGKWKIYDVD